MKIKKNEEEKVERKCSKENKKRKKRNVVDSEDHR